MKIYTALSSILTLYVFKDISAGGFCGIPFSNLKTDKCNGQVIVFSSSFRNPVDKSAY
jgi:hypothetical protein